RERHDFAAVLFLEPQRFLESVAVRLVHFKADIGFLNPVPGDGERGILGGNLFHTDDDVHEVLFLALPCGPENRYLPVQRLKISAAFVPPKPKEFESAKSTDVLRATFGT